MHDSEVEGDTARDFQNKRVSLLSFLVADFHTGKGKHTVDTTSEQVRKKLLKRYKKHTQGQRPLSVGGRLRGSKKPPQQKQILVGQQFIFSQ